MYNPIHCHSTYSLLDCASQIPDIVKKVQQFGSPALAITDHASISNAVEFSKECKKAHIKPIHAVEFNVCEHPSTDKTRRNYSHLLLYAKNKLGWKQLLKIVSKSNSPDHFYYKPRLSLEEIEEILQGQSQLIAVCGHVGSIFSEYVRNSNFEEKSIKLTHRLKEIFGQENVFYEIQLVDQDNLPEAKLLGGFLRDLSKKTQTKCVGTGDAHYLNKDDSHDHRVLLCVNLKTTLQQVQKQLVNDEDVSLGGFFRSNNYYLHSYEEMSQWNTQKELKNTILLSDMCESYDITSAPVIPKFPCPDGLTPIEYLTKLCREGWRSKQKHIDQTLKNGLTKEEYGERFKHELDVIGRANLSEYFLLVWDYCRFAKENNILLGAGRGSSSGSLLAYLLDIVNVNPLQYNLLFERFYNEARSSSLPDIDTDCEQSGRPKIINYIKEKYGRDKVASVCTMNSLKGRAALKETLRVNGVCNFDEMNRITEYIPDEAKITDYLQQQRDDGNENPSIIQYSLETNANELRQWCWINSEGDLEGPLSKYFEQAMRLENVKRNISKHACAIAISNEPLNEVVPMIFDKSSGEEMVGFHKKDLEACGVVKIDLLSLSLLDKLQTIKDLLLHK